LSGWGDAFISDCRRRLLVSFNSKDSALAIYFVRDDRDLPIMFDSLAPNVDEIIMPRLKRSASRWAEVD
jgi:hypothetical protein